MRGGDASGDPFDESQNQRWVSEEQHDERGVWRHQVPPRMRSGAGQISRAKKMTPRMLIGMDMRSPISLALASSAFSIADRMPALRARRLLYTWAPSWPDSRMMSARSASSDRPSSADKACSASHGGNPDHRLRASSSPNRLNTQLSPTS